MRGKRVSRIRTPTSRPPPGWRSWRPVMSVERAEGLAERPESVAYRLGIGGGGELAEIRLPVPDGRGRVTEPRGQAAAVAHFTEGLRGEEEDPVHGGASPAEVAPREVDPLQVPQHPNQDRVGRDGVEVARVEAELTAREPLDEPPAVVLREAPAAVEGIEEARGPALLHPNHEVPGEPDAVDGDPRPRPHVHVDHRQGDRDAEPPIEYLVEEAVPRVVVVPLVALEAVVLEQEPAQG